MTDSRKTLSIPLALVIVIAVMAGAAVTGFGLQHLLAPPAAVSGLRWSRLYGELFLKLALLTVLAGLWRGPLIGAIVVATAAAIGLGVVAPVVMIAAFALSAQTLGRWILGANGNHPIDEMLIGLTLFGTLFGLLAHFPVNNAGLWDTLIALPLILGWRHLRDTWFSLTQRLLSRTRASLQHRLLLGAIVAAAGLNLLAALMPEVGHDALAMHMFVPIHVAQHGSWSFDARTYSWAVMPMLVEWLYSAGYLLAGSHGMHLINAGGIFLLASLVYRTSRWAGATANASACAVLIFLVTPLVFTEGSSLFIEALWSALLVGGTLALLRLLTDPERTREDLLAGGLLLGGALAAKAVTFTALPILALIVLLGAKRWFRTQCVPALGLGFLLFLVVGSIPYLTAYVKTGNPVFPFYNALFHSPLYPAKNFAPPAIFARGVQWNTLYRMTFDSSQYIEGSPGSAGFQWLMLVAPGLIIAVLARHRRTLLISLIGAAWIGLAFHETAYLRYVFPAFALACVPVAFLLTTARSSNKWAAYICVASTLATTTLNLMFFDAGTYYGAIDFGVLTNTRTRQDYLFRRVPLRDAIALVNRLDPQGTPVAFFCNAMAAGLRGNALYPNWYNPAFSALTNATRDVNAMGTLLAGQNVEYVLLDHDWAHTPIGERAAEATTELVNINGISVRRLDSRFRFTQELLPSTNIGKGWQLAAGAVAQPGGGVRVNVMSPAYVDVAVQPGWMYRYVAQARCAAGPAQGRLQVNWLGPKGQFVGASIRVFTCSAQTSTYTMDLAAPIRAVTAVVYASGQTPSPIVFSSISFRK